MSAKGFTFITIDVIVIIRICTQYFFALKDQFLFKLVLGVEENLERNSKIMWRKNLV
jgi:hypothetical protein